MQFKRKVLRAIERNVIGQPLSRSSLLADIFIDLKVKDKIENK